MKCIEDGCTLPRVRGGTRCKACTPTKPREDTIGDVTIPGLAPAPHERFEPTGADRWEQAVTGLCAALEMELGFDRALELVERGKVLARSRALDDRCSGDPLAVAQHAIVAAVGNGLAHHLRGRP